VSSKKTASRLSGIRLIEQPRQIGVRYRLGERSEIMLRRSFVFVGFGRTPQRVGRRRHVVTVGTSGEAVHAGLHRIAQPGNLIAGENAAQRDVAVGLEMRDFGSGNIAVRSARDRGRVLPFREW
jgi:hypothetical protein